MLQQETKPAVRPSREWTPWEPFSAMTHLRDTWDQMFSDLFRNVTRMQGTEMLTWAPAVDMYKQNNSMIVELAVPGLKSNEIEIEVEQDRLAIRGEYKRTEEHKKEDFFRSEMVRGHFARTVALPYAVRTDQVKAKLENGILKITMPLLEPTAHKANKVKID